VKALTSDQVLVVADIRLDPAEGIDDQGRHADSVLVTIHGYRAGEPEDMQVLLLVDYAEALADLLTRALAMISAGRS
jgi:hypothetical protein